MKITVHGTSSSATSDLLRSPECIIGASPDNPHNFEHPEHHDGEPKVWGHKMKNVAVGRVLIHSWILSVTNSGPLSLLMIRG